MQSPKSSICVICGTRLASTSEHLPPRGFFKGTSGQFRTVPACKECNNGSSQDDEILRNYISLQIGKQTEASKKLWENGALRSLNRSQRIRSNLFENMYETKSFDNHDKKQICLSFLVPTDLYQRVFERVTKGYFFLHSGKLLPQKTPIKINLLNTPPDLSLHEFQILEYHSFSEEIFEYRFGFDPDNFCNSLWLFTVHKSHWIQSITGII